MRFGRSAMLQPLIWPVGIPDAFYLHLILLFRVAADIDAPLLARPPRACLRQKVARTVRVGQPSTNGKNRGLDPYGVSW